ncbi:MAG: ABC transporter ATP-binding protein, partial [Halanaerobiales bacterium]
MFELKNVKFKGILYIQDLLIEGGEITCIVGKSGGGKTTLLKLLNNMISPDSGIIRYRGRDLEDYDPLALRREVLMLPQNPVMFPGTIRDNFCRTLDYTESDFSGEESFHMLLDKVGLEMDLDSRADRLSGGEKQRVALARVLLLEPEVLLLDEPSSSLDEDTEAAIIRMVVDYIGEKEGTLVMVTHSRSVAGRYGDVIITLGDGE